MALIRYTYDERADAINIIFDEDRTRGRAVSSSVVAMPFNGASMCVARDASGRALSLEILGVSRIFTESAVEAIRQGRTPFEDLPPWHD